MKEGVKEGGEDEDKLIKKARQATYKKNGFVVVINILMLWPEIQKTNYLGERN